jgi:hypothetical protein
MDSTEDLDRKGPTPARKECAENVRANVVNRIRSDRAD